MGEMSSPDQLGWRDKALSWKCNHFSIHSSKGDTVWLLQELARRLAELGNVEVLDVVVSFERNESVDAVRGTVYFSTKAD